MSKSMHFCSYINITIGEKYFREEGEKRWWFGWISVTKGCFKGGGLGGLDGGSGYALNGVLVVGRKERGLWFDAFGCGRFGVSQGKGFQRGWHF